MDCSKCIDKCKAECCTYVPFKKDFFLKHEHKIKKEVVKHKTRNYIFCVDEDKRCAFLEDSVCTIYNERPDVCRDFGNETRLMLACPWQTKDGAIRTRSKRRDVDRKQKKGQRHILNNFDIKEL